MGTHSSTLAWKIPWAEEPGRLQSMGSRRVGHDWATSLSLFTFMRWRRKWPPTPVFLPGESQGPGSLVGCRLWVAQSWTRLKWCSSSSRSFDWKCHGICTWGAFHLQGLLWWEYKGQQITFELRRFLPFPTSFASRTHSTPKCVASSQSEGSCFFFFLGLPWTLTSIECVVLCHLAYTPFLCSYLASCLL